MFEWFTNQMQMPLGFFKGGLLNQNSLIFMGQRIAPNICYEDLFGEELAVQFKDADHSPSILVNMSNIAWFGDSVILDQHLEISRMRALELRRPMIRATNTGVSAIIDHTGRVDVKAKFFSKEAIKGVVQGRFDRSTFFAWWASRYGLLPLWVLALLVLGTSWCQKILASKHQRQVQEKLEN
jgi:apolipoprotein N-acyltransferase